MRAILSRRRRAQTHAGVVLDRLRDRPLGLAQRALGGVRRGGERRAEGAREELVRGLVEREARGLAGAADDAAGGAREAREVVLRAARRARGELRGEARGEQELEAERQLVRRVARAGSASSSASSLQSRLKTSGCGSSVSNRRATASHARAAASSARAVGAQARVALDRLARR